MPPTSAWEELTGMPRYQVTRFHKLALASAASTTAIVIAPGRTISAPMVWATATPSRNGPEKLAAAASRSAPRALIACEAIIVATMLALSWKPFRKSNSRAMTSSAMSRTRGVIGSAAGPCPALAEQAADTGAGDAVDCIET